MGILQNLISERFPTFLNHETRDALNVRHEYLLSHDRGIAFVFDTAGLHI